MKDESIAINAICACNKRDTARLTEDKWLELQDWGTVCCYKDCGCWERTLPSVYQHISSSTGDRYCVYELPASSSSNKPRINKKFLTFAKRQANFWKDTARFLAAAGGFLHLHPLNSVTETQTSFKLHLSILSSPACLYCLSEVLRFPGQNFVWMSNFHICFLPTPQLLMAKSIRTFFKQMNR
jgi:hypothetical protein